MQVKFPEEVRLSLGVAQVEYNNSTIEGKRATPFVYTGKILLLIDDYAEEEKKEIARVRSLSGTKAPWYVNDRRKHLWDSDPITMLKKVAKVTAEKLWKHQFITIGDLKYSSPLQLYLYTENGLSLNRLKMLHSQSLLALEGNVPNNVVVNHTLEENPYKSLYKKMA